MRTCHGLTIYNRHHMYCFTLVPFSINHKAYPRCPISLKRKKKRPALDIFETHQASIIEVAEDIHLEQNNHHFPSEPSLILVTLIKWNHAENVHQSPEMRPYKKWKHINTSQVKNFLVEKTISTRYSILRDNRLRSKARVAAITMINHICNVLRNSIYSPRRHQKKCNVVSAF